MAVHINENGTLKEVASNGGAIKSLTLADVYWRNSYSSASTSYSFTTMVPLFVIGLFRNISGSNTGISTIYFFSCNVGNTISNGNYTITTFNTSKIEYSVVGTGQTVNSRTLSILAFGY